MNSRQSSTSAIVAPDPGFNGTGEWFPAGTNPEANLIFGVAVQTVSNGGYVYFTGEADGGLRGRVYVLGRLKPDGTLDSKFAKNGIASDNFASNSPSAGFSIILQIDGKILLVGLAGSRTIPALARYNADGTLDMTFGSDRNGHLVIPRPASRRGLSALKRVQEQDFTPCVVPMANGKILIAHTYFASHIADTRAFIFVLNSDGTPDTTFNKTGRLQVILPGANPDSVKLNSGFIDDKGNIAVCGKLTENREPAGLFIARYTPQGVPDTSFHGTGFRVFKTPDLVDATLNSLVRQTNNRLLGVGNTSDGQGFLISLEPNGEVNIQFNSGKTLLTRLENNLTVWRDAAMQADGKILLMGAITAPLRSYAVFARLLSDGKEDTEFSDNSFWVKARASTFLSSLALQDDGKIIAGGFEYPTGSKKAMVMRFHRGIGGKNK